MQAGIKTRLTPFYDLALYPRLLHLLISLHSQNEYLSMNNDQRGTSRSLSIRHCKNCKSELENDYVHSHCPHCLAGAEIKPRYTDLTLNNGKIARFLRVDWWHRPRYRITLDDNREFEVCCTELNGTYLHTMSGGCDPEPELPLKHEFQPVNT